MNEVIMRRAWLHHTVDENHFPIMLAWRKRGDRRRLGELPGQVQMVHPRGTQFARYQGKRRRLSSGGCRSSTMRKPPCRSSSRKQPGE